MYVCVCVLEMCVCETMEGMYVCVTAFVYMCWTCVYMCGRCVCSGYGGMCVCVYVLEVCICVCACAEVECERELCKGGYVKINGGRNQISKQVNWLFVHDKIKLCAYGQTILVMDKPYWLWTDHISSVLGVILAVLLYTWMKFSLDTMHQN